MSASATTDRPDDVDAARAGQILLDILSFADAATWRDSDPLPNPFAELSAKA